ncbi:MAG: hypothetical protein NVSMB14_14860 [Isosphaeraceae bacterium]
MARETDLIDTSVDVAEVIHEYARKKSWSPGSYRVEVIVYTDFYTLSIFLFTDFPLSENDRHMIYYDLRDEIHKKYKANGKRPSGFNTFGIIVAGEGDFRKDWIPSYEDAVYVDSALLNPPPVGASH